MTNSMTTAWHASACTSFESQVGSPHLLRAARASDARARAQRQSRLHPRLSYRPSVGLSVHLSTCLCLCCRAVRPVALVWVASGVVTSVPVLSVRWPVRLSCLSVRPSAHPSPSTCPPVHPTNCPSVCLFCPLQPRNPHLPVSLSARSVRHSAVSTRPLARPPVSSSFHSSVCPSVRLSVHAAVCTCSTVCGIYALSVSRSAPGLSSACCLSGSSAPTFPPTQSLPRVYICAVIYVCNHGYPGLLGFCVHVLCMGVCPRVWPAARACPAVSRIRFICTLPCCDP